VLVEHSCWSIVCKQMYFCIIFSVSMVWAHMHSSAQYLLSDLDEQDEDDKHEQVVKDADSSGDDVNDLEMM